MSLSAETLFPRNLKGFGQSLRNHAFVSFSVLARPSSELNGLVGTTKSNKIAYDKDCPKTENNIDHYEPIANRDTPEVTSFSAKRDGEALDTKDRELRLGEKESREALK